MDGGVSRCRHLREAGPRWRERGADHGHESPEAFAKDLSKLVFLQADSAFEAQLQHSRVTLVFYWQFLHRISLLKVHKMRARYSYSKAKNNSLKVFELDG
jgi:hypothetical protein